MLRRLLQWGLELGLTPGAPSGLPLLRALGLALGLAVLGLSVPAQVRAAQPVQIGLSAAPVWKGWSRPGRETELQVQLSADVATRLTLQVAAGNTSTQAAVQLQPGRVVRLQLPVRAVEKIDLSARADDGAAVSRVVDVSLSESPVLGVALSRSEPVQLDGFHAVALNADDLPRQAAAYASIDALIIDAATLAALDRRQLAALLAHAGACGRIAVVNADAQVQRLLAGAGGCAGQALMSADTLARAQELLSTSLASNLPAAMTLAGMGELARPAHGAWNRVATVLAVYFAVAVLVLLFRSSLTLLLVVPALASVAALAMLHLLQPAPQMLVWSESDSGAPSARYQSWQRFSGLVRGPARVAVPPQLAGSAQACDRQQAMHFEWDADKDQVAAVEFDTRLFQQVLLCHAGSFPTGRTPQVGAALGEARDVRNAGNSAWPTGVLIAEGRVHGLPALAPGARTAINLKTHQTQPDAAARAALARLRPDEVAALWELDLGGVAEVPAQSRGWLLVAAPATAASAAKP